MRGGGGCGISKQREIKEKQRERRDGRERAKWQAARYYEKDEEVKDERFVIKKKKKSLGAKLSLEEKKRMKWTAQVGKVFEDGSPDR